MDAWQDQRILRPVCRTHHGMMHSANFHLWRYQLPPSVIRYAEEHDLIRVLDEADQRRRESERAA